MLISEVRNLTGLTKKAISYYEQQGLIKPIRGVNRYREYSQLDVKLLNEISSYRKLDICISDIREIINNENKKEIVNKIILKNKHKKELALKRQREYLQKINNNSFFKNNIGEEIEKDSIKVDLNYERVNNISVNSENTKEALGACLNYINKIGKLDELIIITQYSASELIELLNEGVMPAKLASYILDIVEIDIQVLVGVRKLTDLEKILLDRKE